MNLPEMVLNVQSRYKYMTEIIIYNIQWAVTATVGKQEIFVCLCVCVCVCVCVCALRKHAYSNILNILQPKKWKIFRYKVLIFFIFLLKT